MLVINSSLLISDKSSTLIFLIAYETSLIKFSSSLLFFAMENFDEMMFSSVMGIVTVRGAWSEESCQSGWIEWLLSSVEPLHKNMRLMTKFASPVMSEYLCCSNHSPEWHLWYADFSKALNRLSSSGDYKRTQQGALAALLSYLYKLQVVHAITMYLPYVYSVVTVQDCASCSNVHVSYMW